MALLRYSAPAHRHAFDFHQQPRMGQFADADAGPGAEAFGEYAVLHVTKHRHMLAHVDVIGGHLYHIVEGATAGLQHLVEVFPGANELLLGVFDDFQICRAAYLTGASRRNARWRVDFNGLGDLAFCPAIRKTDAVLHGLQHDVLGHAKAFAASIGPQMLERALSWAYLSETEGSFAIEGESPSEDKASRFAARPGGLDPLVHAGRGFHPGDGPGFAGDPPAARGGVSGAV